MDVSTAAKIVAKHSDRLGRSEAFDRFCKLVEECQSERFAVDSREAYLKLSRQHEARLQRAAEELGL